MFCFNCVAKIADGPDFCPYRNRLYSKCYGKRVQPGKHRGFYE